MKYIYITFIFFLFIMPLAYADVDSDRCSGVMKYDYAAYIKGDVEAADSFPRGSKRIELLAIDVQDSSEDVEDFGSINYAQYRDSHEYPARYMNLTDCHVEASNNSPYYWLVANNPLEHTYQELIFYYWNRYEDDTNLGYREAENRAYDILRNLLVNKNSFCSHNWHFCFNVELLIEAYPKVKFACMNAASDDLYADISFDDAFNLGSNQFDRNSGIVTLFDEFSESESSQEGKKTDHITKFSCTYSMEDGKVIESHLN